MHWAAGRILNTPGTGDQTHPLKQHHQPALPHPTLVGGQREDAGQVEALLAGFFLGEVAHRVCAAVVALAPAVWEGEGEGEGWGGGGTRRHSRIVQPYATAHAVHGSQTAQPPWHCSSQSPTCTRLT